MSKNIGLRSAIFAVLIIVALVYLVPTFSKELPAWWKFLPAEKIKLGLDLQGGMHLVLEVDVDKALEAELERIAEDIKEDMRNEKIRHTDISRNSANGIDITLLSEQEFASFEALKNAMYPDYDMVKGEKTEEGLVVHMKMTEAAIQDMQDSWTEQALETIRNRIDQFGVNEPDISTQQDNRILIQLPGIKDPDRAINLIGQTAQLEFKLVDEENSGDMENVPAGDEILYHTATDSKGRTAKTPYMLKKQTALTGSHITNAQVKQDEYGAYYINLTLDKKGARIFESLTGANVGKRLAIVLDNNVYSAPVIQDKISGGDAAITGTFTLDEANDLRIVLKAGALPAPIKILEQRTVGPSLGQDSISQGINAMILGGALVILFMIIYYGLSGFIAVFALVLNTLIIMAGLAFFGATLTLPGLAGMVLSIGMAVDANVLIYERIREEMRAGKTLRTAVEAGYDKATITIFDSNLTTLITALILFQFGTGPVKGFAVTLTIGIIANFITAVYVTRVIFDYLVVELNWKKISI
ncbi:MAG: protein translocase subunit SecD [Deltaproteobacteria bacterium]|nr:protein translocase subunit SecD [Deltaproteobacteria bacterium]